MALHISYDHQIFLAQKYGGISRYYYEIASRLAALGNNVEILAPFYSNEYFLQDCPVRPRGVKIPLLPKTVRLMPEIVNSVLSRLLNKSRRNMDIFHETYYSMFDSCPRLAKRVITVFDMIHEKFPENLSSRVRRTKAHAVSRADHVICISESTRHDLIELLDVPEQKTSVVYLGHSLNMQNTVVEPSGMQMPFILYVGSRSGYKNFATLLRAYGRSQRLKNEFSLVCFGGEGISDRERELMASLNISPEGLKFMSGSDDVLAGLYAAASVFICPSLYEGFGIPTLEAMSFGCPVACSNTSSLPEVAGNAAELFDPTDEEQISNVIERIVFSSETAKRMVKCGYERIKQFSWDKCARETLNVYENILRMAP